MEIKIYTTLPQSAIDIRNEVFVREQGFQEEFDSIDATAIHLVALEGDTPMGTCRIYASGGVWFLGRLAVRKAYRGTGLGAKLVRSAQARAKQAGATTLRLHAQTRAMPFYEKQGYHSTGITDQEEGCPHTWMEIQL